MIITITDSFVRPANTTAYTAGDLVANDVDAADVVPLKFSVARLGSGRGIVRRIILFKDDETTTAAAFNLHLFSESPAVNNGDNGAFQPTTVQNYLGTVAIDMSTGAVASATDLAKGGAPAAEINFDLRVVGDRERRLYGLLEATGAYAPSASELFEVTLEIAGTD